MRKKDNSIFITYSIAIVFAYISCDVFLFWFIEHWYPTRVIFGVRLPNGNIKNNLHAMTATSYNGGSPDDSSAGTAMPPTTQQIFAQAQRDTKEWPIPRMRLVIDDLSSVGSAIFLHHVNVARDLRLAALTVMRLLYTIKLCPHR